MAVVITELTANFTDTAGTSAVTASVVLPANVPIIAMVHTTRTASATQAVAGASTGATWVEIANRVFNTDATPRSRLTALRTMVTSEQTGAITWSCTSSHDRWLWGVFACAGADTSGTNGSGAIVQSVATGGIGMSGSVGPTLATFGNAANALLLGGSTDNGTTIGMDSPLTAFTMVSSGTTIRSLRSGWQVGEDLTPTLTGAGDWAAIGIEIKAAVVAAGLATRKSLLGVGI